MLRISTPGVWMPEEYTVCSQNPRNLEEIWSSAGLYCPVCFPVSRDLGVFSRPGTEDPKAFGDYIKWDVKLLELAESAEKGCQFCCFMIDRFFNDPMYSFFYSNQLSNPYGCCYMSKEHQDTEKVKKAVTRSREMCEKHDNPSFVLIAQPDDFSVEEQKYERLRFLIDRTDLKSGKDFEDIMGYRRQIVLEISTTEDDPSAQYIKARPVDIHPESPDSIEKVKSWITDCFGKHLDCTTLPGQRLPGRVIKIVDDENLVLIPGGSFGYYTILSYCWGGTQSFSTTKDTLQSRKAGFKVHDLPLTLRDAVRLTRALGVDYIWIDSLCIIQDSVDDKQSELPKMPSYYRGSYVTICAAGQDCNSGFLHMEGTDCEIHRTGIPPNLLQMPILCPSGATGSIFFGEEVPYNLSAEPISQRAWTFQERVLSPRILMYGGRTMWLCNSCQKSAGGVQDWSFDNRSTDTRKLRAGLRHFAKVKSGSAGNLEPSAESKLSSLMISSTENSDLELRNLYDLWYYAVREYTMRDLTFPEDKLPAVAALADEFCTISDDEYAAGLWTSDMLRGLLWSTWPHIHHDRSDRWRAPSWSWASVKNAVTYNRLPGKGVEVEELTKVIRVEIKPKAALSRFGEISEGFLDVHGPVMKLDATKIADIVRVEYSFPGPQDSNDWRSLMMYLTTPKGEPENREDWTVPEGTVLLVLLAEKIHESESQRQDADKAQAPVSEVEESTESIRPDDPAAGIADTETAIPSSIEYKTPDQASEVEQQKSSGDGKEDEERATIHALVLAPVAKASDESGIPVYERIGSITQLNLTGYRHLRGMAREVRII